MAASCSTSATQGLNLAPNQGRRGGFDFSAETRDVAVAPAAATKPAEDRWWRQAGEHLELEGRSNRVVGRPKIGAVDRLAVGRSVPRASRQARPFLRQRWPGLAEHWPVLPHESPIDVPARACGRLVALWERWA